MDTTHDIILVGGGLQSGLIAAACHELRPSASITIIERDEQLGGNHIWCFHESDLPAGAKTFVDPLVAVRWSRTSVHFPGFKRTLTGAYAAVTNHSLHQAVTSMLRRPGCSVELGVNATVVTAEHVQLDDGRRLTADCIIDARGARGPVAETGYQSFVGLEVELADNHDLDHPVLMDATVDQTNGFHFVYVLPLGPRRLLLEDTCFNEDAELDRPGRTAFLHQYAQAHDYTIESVVRTEEGVLPMPWGAAEGIPATAEPLPAGYRGGWFHPGTGYSIPVAARLAETIARHAHRTDRRLAIDKLASNVRAQSRYARFLNRLMFRWYPPHQRVNILRRFYGLPEPIIQRFYALTPTPLDKARILVGRPPAGLSWRHRRAQGRPSP